MISEERAWILWGETDYNVEAFARAVEAEATADLRANNERLRGLLTDMRAADQSFRVWQWAPRIDAALAAEEKKWGRARVRKHD